MTLLKLVISLVAFAAVLAVFVGYTSRRAAQNSAAAAVAYPAVGKMLLVNGARVHYTIEGSGPDLILIHGASGNLRDMAGLAAHLAPRFRVIRFDRPGLGYSALGDARNLTPQGQAETLRAAAAQLHLTQPIVLGHSFGGAVAMAWALQAPDTTAGLVLVSAATMPWESKLDPVYRAHNTTLGRVMIPALVAAYATPARVDAGIKIVFAPQSPPEDYRETIGAALIIREDSFRTNADQINALKRSLRKMAIQYPQMTLPVEILHGDIDTIVGLEIHSRPLSALLPNARLTVLPGFGHMPHQAAPEAVIAAIDRLVPRLQ